MRNLFVLIFTYLVLAVYGESQVRLAPVRHILIIEQCGCCDIEENEARLQRWEKAIQEWEAKFQEWKDKHKIGEIT